MKKEDHINNHDKFASTYDSQVKEYKSYGHEVLFGMCYEFINPGELLLDLGIGTGLSSVHFAEAGLQVSGLDGSREMLNECRKKGFAKELKLHDLKKLPLPYNDASFDHIICCGVVHFMGDLLPIIEDVRRILKSGGIFAFTIASFTENPDDPAAEKIPEYIKTPTVWGISLFQHSDNYIKKITEFSDFEIMKEQKLLMDSGDKQTPELTFKVFVTKKKN